MDTLLVLQIFANLALLYASIIWSKVAYKAVTGEWTGMSKENAILAFLIGVMMALICFFGTIGCVIELFEKAS